MSFEIDDVRVEPAGAGWRTSAVVRHPRGEDTIWFETPVPVLARPIDAFLTIAARCAMLTDGRVRTATPVSHRLAEGLWRISRLRRSWLPQTAETVMDAPRRDAAENVRPGRSRASFFTAGVDSYHTALDPRLEIDTLISVLGADISLDNAELSESILARWSEAAAVLGRRLLVVRTNLRQLTNQYMSWADLYPGGLSAVGHLLGGDVGVAYHAASLSWNEMSWPPNDPVSIPLYASESIWFGFHGAEVTRQAKVDAVAHLPIVQRTLQVCIANPRRGGNCSRCEKCLRTMLALHAVDRLESFATFEGPVDLKRVRRLRPRLLKETVYFEELLRVLGTRPNDVALAAALDHVLRRMRGRTFRQRWRRLRERLGLRAAAPTRN